MVQTSVPQHRGKFSMFLLDLETTTTFTKEARKENWGKEGIKSIMYKSSHNVPKSTTEELL